MYVAVEDHMIVQRLKQTAGNFARRTQIAGFAPDLCRTISENRKLEPTPIAGVPHIAGGCRAATDVPISLICTTLKLKTSVG